MKKRFLAAVLCAALSVSLAACSSAPRASDSDAAVLLPEPSADPVQSILGEQISTKPELVSLHYVSGDGSSFSTITRNLVISPGENLYQEAIDSLLYNAASPDHMSFIPSEVRVISADFADGIVTVDFSLDTHNIQDEQEYLMLIASVSNTLLSMENVRGVNVLINGRSRSISALPVGTLAKTLTGITPTYAQFMTERDYFLESETGTITRYATLYFPTKDDVRFVPELREIVFDSSDYTSALIKALRAGPSESSCSVSAIPEGADLLVDNPKMHVNSAGERIVELNFAPTLRNYLAFSGIEEWDLVGSLVLTVCSFVPELDAVRICINNEPIDRCSIGDVEYVFEGGVVRREVFESYIGNTAKFYLPDGNGTLVAAERAVAPVCAQSPLHILNALFDEMLSIETDVEVFPSGVYNDDLLGLSVEDGIASVNLSANFYRRTQSLDETAERCLVYAMVNTVCEMENISGVRFYIEGVTAESLSGSIYLKGILLPNPGIVFRDSSVISTQ